MVFHRPPISGVLYVALGSKDERFRVSALAMRGVMVGNPSVVRLATEGPCYLGAQDALALADELRNCVDAINRDEKERGQDVKKLVDQHA